VCCHHSTKSKRLILQLPTVIPLWLCIHFMQTTKRSGDSTHPCRSPTVKFLVFTPQLFGSIISRHLFQGTWHILFLWRLRRGMLFCSCLPFCEGEWSPQFSLFLILFQNNRPAGTHKSAKELFNSRLWAFQVGFHHCLQCSAAVVVFSALKCTLCVFSGVIVMCLKDLWNTLHLS